MRRVVPLLFHPCLLPSAVVAFQKYAAADDIHVQSPDVSSAAVELKRLATPGSRHESPIPTLLKRMALALTLALVFSIMLCFKKLSDKKKGPVNKLQTRRLATGDHDPCLVRQEYCSSCCWLERLHRERLHRERLLLR